MIKKTKNKIFFISPEEINFCIFPTKYCDHTQFKLDKSHPHAGINRGFFEEDLSGNIKINGSNWDTKPGVKFSNLLEFKALKNHYSGKENWKKSDFAHRCIKHMKKNNLMYDPRNLKKNFKNFKEFLIKRERQIDAMFDTAITKGIYPIDLNSASNKYKKLVYKQNKKLKGKKFYIDNISVVITKNLEFYFNNHGHHRLSVAKILGLKKIPVKIVIAKSEKLLKKFISMR